MTLNLKLGVVMLAKQMQVELADLSDVADPEGRIDFLASKIFEQAARALAPELQMTYHAARPLIDGLLVKHLGQVRVKVPDEVKRLLMESAAGAREAA